MKILLLFANEYWLKPFEKNLTDAPDATEPMQAEGAILALVHVEAEDIDRQSKLVTKGIKQIKWLAGKFQSRNIVLHSFAHLASSNASPSDAQAILAEMGSRLTSAGYSVQTSPFGYFNEFRVHVAGPSLAKVFVDL